MCQHHRSNQNSHPPVLVRKPLCNQFIHYHISSRGVFGINHFKLRNFAVVAMKFSFATVDRSSIMARIHRLSVMIYGSLQAEFMETKNNSHIHRYGTPVFGKIVVNISKSINNDNQIFWRLWNIIRFDMPSVLLASKASNVIKPPGAFFKDVSNWYNQNIYDIPIS